MNGQHAGFRFITSRELTAVPEGAAILGVEATRPDTIVQCTLGNIDPQHSGDNPEKAAIDAAVEGVEHFRRCYLGGKYDDLPDGSFLSTQACLCGQRTPEDEAVARAFRATNHQPVWLVTDRPDADSVGAMAVLEVVLRFFVEEPRLAYRSAEGAELELALEQQSAQPGTRHFGREDDISRFDRHHNGAWRPTRLPSMAQMWPEPGGQEMSALAAMVADHSKPLEARVELAIEWLKGEDSPIKPYLEMVELDRLGVIAALNSGDTKLRLERGVVLVESVLRTATTIGYSISPIVVAVNENFRWQGGEPHTKFTISQFAEGYVNLRAALEELNELDDASTHGNTWGGSTTIGGSPQGVSSKLTPQEVVDVMVRHRID